MNLLFELILLQIISFKGVLGAIQFTNEPKDTTVTEGSTAIFHCSYTGTNDVPGWLINGGYYQPPNFPPRHSYSNEILTVRDAQLSDSGKTYRCVFSMAGSQIGTLYVRSGVPEDQGTDADNIHHTTSILESVLPTSVDHDGSIELVATSSSPSSPTTAQGFPLEDITPTVTFLFRETTTGELNEPISESTVTIQSNKTTAGDPLAERSIEEFIALGGGLALGIFALILMVIIMMILLLMKYNKHQKNKQSEESVCKEPEYETIEPATELSNKDNLHIDANVCYSSSSAQKIGPVYEEILPLKNQGTEIITGKNSSYGCPQLRYNRHAK